MMRKNIFKAKLNFKIIVKFTFIFLLFLLSILFFLNYQKMSLNKSMTFNSSIENQYCDEKNNNKTNFYLITMHSTNCNSNYDSSKFNQLSPMLYAIILALSIPIIIFLIVIFIPSKKIVDTMIALDINKNKNKREKQNLGVQKPPRFELDDENL